MLGFYQKSWCSLIFLQLGFLDVLHYNIECFFYSKDNGSQVIIISACMPLSQQSTNMFHSVFEGYTMYILWFTTSFCSVKQCSFSGLNYTALRLHCKFFLKILEFIWTLIIAEEIAAIANSLFCNFESSQTNLE